MRVFVFVNRVCEIGYRQTTALLIAAFYRKGHEVFLANVDGVSIHGKANQQDRPALFIDALRLDLSHQDASSRDVAQFAQSAGASGESQSLRVCDEDLVVIRTNPGRDLERSTLHTTFLETCQVAKASDIRVVNDPNRLSFFASKAAVAVLPAEYRPEMLVTNDMERVEKFIRESNRDCVVKPLLGSRGNDVIRVDANCENIAESLDRFENQSIVVQHFIDSEEPGDKRVVVLNGQILEQDEHVAGIHRVPAEGDFRANLHAGGTARLLKLTPEQRAAALAAASILYDAGVELAGVDLIGNKVIEFNVFSTGGLYDANQFSGIDFADLIIEGI